MSQEINLLNPALRPQRDWLCLKPVAIATLASFVLIGTFYGYASYQASEVLQQQAVLHSELTAQQRQLQKLQADLAARKPSVALEQESLRTAEAVEYRKEVLRLAQQTATVGVGGLADVMRGFSRQIVEGVWLTGFGIGASGIDIRGRLLDPSLLPTYIRRLNSEPAFRGRRFAALDMQGVVLPADTAAPAVQSPAAAQALARYTEFVLRASVVPQTGGRE